MTARVYAWPKHLRARCPEGGCGYEGPGDCVHVAYFCCRRCGGAEGQLPSDCPGEWMGPGLADAVYAGEANYLRGPGWVRPWDRQWRPSWQ